MFQVAVGEVALGVVEGDETTLDVVREGEPPQVAVAKGVEEHTSHSGFGGISGSQERRVLRHELGKVGRAVSQASSKRCEGVDMSAQGFGDADATVGHSIECHLQGAEQSD